MPSTVRHEIGMLVTDLVNDVLQRRGQIVIRGHFESVVRRDLRERRLLTFLFDADAEVRTETLD